MTIKDIMTPQPVVIAEEDSISDAAKKMKELEIGFLPVGNKNDIEGVITDRDITVRCVAEGKDPSKEKVKEYMSKGIKSIFMDSSPEEARRIMSDNKIRRLMVVDNEQHPVGVLALGDLVVDAGTDVAGSALKDISKPSKPDR